MARISVTESELAEAVRGSLAVHSNPDDAFTSDEIARALNCGNQKARRAIADLSKQGRVVVVPRRTESIAGKVIIVPSYRILKAKKK